MMFKTKQLFIRKATNFYFVIPTPAID